MLDPFRGYERALRTGLGNATVVLDSFHAVRLGPASHRRRPPAGAATDPWHRGHKADPPYRIRRVLLNGGENLTPHAYGRLLAGPDASALNLSTELREGVPFGASIEVFAGVTGSLRSPWFGRPARRSPRSLAILGSTRLFLSKRGWRGLCRPETR